jgi:hypothetical protein
MIATRGDEDACSVVKIDVAAADAAVRALRIEFQLRGTASQRPTSPFT